MAVIDILLNVREKNSRAIQGTTNELRELKSQADRTTSSLGVLGTSMAVAAGTLLAQGAAMAARALGGFIGTALGTASAIEETGAKFDTVFGEYAESARTELTEMANVMNRSKYDFFAWASSVQDTFVPLGFAREEAAKLSTSLVKLAVDVGSFNNVSEPEVMRDFQSALVGNHEAVRKFGIVITEATMKEELMRLGAEELTGAALEQAKVQARLNLIIAGTTDAHGDAERTAGSYANVMRGLSAAIGEMRAGIGASIMPQLTPFLEMLTELVREVAPDVIGFFSRIGEVMAPFFESMVAAKDRIAAIIEGIAGIGSGILTLFEILTGQLTEASNSWADKFEGVPTRLKPFFEAIANAIVAIREFFGWLWDISEPVRNWIQEHIKISDVLIALAGLLSINMVEAIGAFLLHWGRLAAVFAGAVLLVAAIRTAWETDFLGIRTAILATVDAVHGLVLRLVGTFKENFPGALAEIWEFVKGNDTEFTKLKKILYDVKDAFRIFFQELGLAWDPVISYVRDKIREWWETLNGFVQERFGGWAGMMLAFGKVAWEWLLEAIKYVRWKINEWWTVLDGYVKSKYGSWGEMFLLWGETIWKWISTGIQSARTKISEWWTLLDGYVREKYGSWKDMLLLWGGHLWEFIKTGTSFVLGLITSWWTTLSTSVQQNYGSWVGLFLNWAGHLYQWIAAGASFVASKVSYWWGILNGEVESRYGSWAGMFLLWGGHLYKFITDAASFVAGQVTSWWTTLNAAVELKYGGWIAMMTQWSTAAYSWITWGIGNITTSVREWWTEFDKRIQEKWGTEDGNGWHNMFVGWAWMAASWIMLKASHFAAKVQEYRDIVNPEFAKIAGDIEIAVENVATTVLEVFTELATGALRSGTEILVAFIEGFSFDQPEASRELEEARSDLAGTLIETLLTLGQELDDAGRKLGIAFIKKVLEGMRDELLRGELWSKVLPGGGKLGDAFETALDPFLSKAASNAQEGGNSIGYYLIEGIRRAFFHRPTLDDLWGTLTDFVNKFIRKTNEGFESHSPSERMKDVGINVVEGLIVGIESLSATVAKSAEELAVQVGDSFEQEFTYQSRRIETAWDDLFAPQRFRGTVDVGGSGASVLPTGVQDALFGESMLTPGGSYLRDMITNSVRTLPGFENFSLNVGGVQGNIINSYLSDLFSALPTQGTTNNYNINVSSANPYGFSPSQIMTALQTYSAMYS